MSTPSTRFSRRRSLAGLGSGRLLLAVALAAAALVEAPLGRAGATPATYPAAPAPELITALSVAAVRALPGLEVHVYVSPDLPDERPAGEGRLLSFRAIGRRLVAVLGTYERAAEGRMKLHVVTEDVVRQGEAAGLELLETRPPGADPAVLPAPGRHVLGATFARAGRTEVLPLVRTARHLEYEISRRLLRLARAPDGPPRPTIGILCGRGGVCPFPARAPVLSAEAAQALERSGGAAAAFAGFVLQLQEQIDQTNAEILSGVLTRPGFRVQPVWPERPIPAEVDALVLWGLRASLPARTLYEVDQFLLSGRPVLALLGRFDARIGELDEAGEASVSGTTPIESNVFDLLSHHGVHVNEALLMEPRDHFEIRLTVTTTAGRVPFTQVRERGYPLLPSFGNLERRCPLVADMDRVGLPYVSAIDPGGAEAAGLEVRRLVLSSRSAVVRAAGFPLPPEELSSWVEAERRAGRADGPHAVAVHVTGTFDSYFSAGRKPPAGVGEGFRPSGRGRLIVVGSDLGLEELSARRVLRDLPLSAGEGDTVDWVKAQTTAVTRYRIWQARLDQRRDVFATGVRGLLPRLLGWLEDGPALLPLWR